MTRKDYILIAAALREAVWEAETGRPGYVPLQETRAVMAIVNGRMADALANDNPRFDRARFLAACGVTANTEN